MAKKLKTEYSTLFSPISIGNMEVKNRIVMTAMGTKTSNTNGSPSQQDIAYFEERAKADVGLIITGLTSVTREGAQSGSGMMLIDEDYIIEPMKKLVDAVHSHGAKIVLQAAHQGARKFSTDGTDILTPSGIAAFPGAPGQQTRAMTEAEVETFIDCFAAAALRVKQAGFDGIEFHGAHNYLIANFLSSHFNKRTDKYGGSIENRFRFLGEIIARSKALVGEDFPILVRISAEEYLNDGLHLDEALLMVQMMEKAGVAAIDISVGGAANGRSHTIEPTSYEQGWRRHFAKAAKALVNVPVIATTVIRSPSYAQWLIEQGFMDMAGSGRNFLADPLWAQKAKAGQEQNIRPCISCCRCIEGLATGSIACSVNPECGRESAVQKPATVSGKKAAVVGAGAAGMQAAIVLAQRGYSVKVYEVRSVAGGQMQLATAIPIKAPMQTFVNWQLRQLKALSVEVLFGQTVTADMLAAQQVDVIIDATGAVPLVPSGIQGSSLPNVKTPVDLLNGSWNPTGESIILVGSGLTGLETAELLVAKGNMVRVLEMANTVAPGSSPINTGEAVRNLTMENVVLQTQRKLLEIQSDRVVCEDVTSGQKFELPCDSVVLSLGVVSAPGLSQDMCGSAKLVKAGDAAAPARIMEATLSGYQVAQSL